MLLHPTRGPCRGHVIALSPIANTESNSLPGRKRIQRKAFFLKAIERAGGLNDYRSANRYLSVIVVESGLRAERFSTGGTSISDSDSASPKNSSKKRGQ